MSRVPQRPVAPPPIEHLPPAPRTNWPPASSRGSWPPPGIAPSAQVARTGLAGWPLWVWLAIGGGVVAITLVIVVIVMIGGAVNTRIANNQAMEDVERTADEFIDAQYQRLLSDAPMSADADEFNSYVTQIEGKLSNMTGDTGKVGRATVAILKSLQPEIASYTAAMTRLSQSAGLDPSAWKSKADIDAFMTATRKAREASLRVEQVYRDLPQRFATELQAQGVADKNIRQAQSGFTAAAALDLTLQALDEDLILCDRMTEAATLLKREWGRWRVDRATGEVTFDSTTTMNKYNTLVDEVLAAADRQMAVQQRAFNQRRAGGTRGR